jgi:nucleoside-diphosphate-sugar epimerase
MVNSIRRALVTGASGFIGTALCGKLGLIASGVQVHGVSRYPPAGTEHTELEVFHCGRHEPSGRSLRDSMVERRLCRT